MADLRLQGMENGDRRSQLVQIQRGLWMPRDPNRPYTLSNLSWPRSFRMQADLSLINPIHHAAMHGKIQTIVHLVDSLENEPKYGANTHSKEQLDMLAELDDLKKDIQGMLDEGEQYRVMAVDTLLEHMMGHEFARGFIVVGTPKGPRYKPNGFHALTDAVATSIGSCTKTVKRLCEKVQEHDELDRQKLERYEERGKRVICWTDPSVPDVLLAPIADGYRARVITREENFEQARRIVENEFDVIWLKNYTESPKPTGFGKDGAAHYIVRQKGSGDNIPAVEIQVWTEQTNWDAIRDGYYKDRKQYICGDPRRAPLLNQ